MYCIECGTQIPDNSKFCSNCGKPQDEADPSVKEKISEKINVRQVVKEQKRNLDYQFFRKVKGWYLAWILLHFGFLLIGSDGIFKGYNMGASKFWPFGSYYHLEISEYDITEFLVYSIFPLAILIIWSIIRSQNQYETNA